MAEEAKATTKNADEKVALYKLFSFADKQDLILIVVGAAAAAGNDAAVDVHVRPTHRRFWYIESQQCGPYRVEGAQLTKISFTCIGEFLWCEECSPGPGPPFTVQTQVNSISVAMSNN
ncbi:uncharacterized protein A4U43_C01F30110 [Asparagus officinalis]|uniref:Uncharacterized protein n=1 Tax=Asparagus officinalis TaxID=4686 RepID=A0A5P1FV28_ASPOF|nr:uncharacterized protein A4U43_C01F30110 [Asparagus officinalis]